MQIALLSLVVAGSTVWLAMDASKRDWTGNSFARNVPNWVAGSLLLWPVVFPLYVFVHRKKAPLLNAPQAERAAAMAASEPSEQYGPSLDEVEADEAPSEADEAPSEPMVEREPVVDVIDVEPEPVVDVIEVEPEPVVENHREPVVEVDREPVVEAVREPVVEIAPQPVVAIEPQAVVAPQAVAEPVIEPEPVVEVERESVVEVAPVEPQPVAEPHPEPVAEPEPIVEPEVEPEPVAEAGPEPVLEISYPDLPVEDAPPGLSVDAFKDIKPVAFGGIAAEDTEAASPAAPEPEPIPTPVVEPELVVEIEPEPVAEVAPEPTPVADFEPLSYPVETEPTIEIEPEPEIEPALATAVAEPETIEESKAKRRGFGIPNPQLKLPSFGGKGGLKLPQITLPPNLQGPLSDLERKIVLGSVVAIVAAAAFGYSSAPKDDAAAPAPPPPPAAASR